MNPMYYLVHKGNSQSQYWSIRHGNKDKDTSLAISELLALAIEGNAK